jgi:hypothetical protein
MADESKVDEVKADQETQAAPEAKPAAKKQQPKRKIWPALALFGGILVFFGVIIGLVMWRTNSKTATTGLTTSSATSKSKTSTKKTNITQKETPSITQSKEDEEKYKGWQTYQNQSWAIFVRYPAGWTKTETTASLHVTILGPATPAGGVILNECAFSIFVEDVPDTMTLENYVAAARAAPLGGGSVVEQTDTSIGDSTALKVIDTYADVGAPWKRLRVWTIKNGRAYTFTFAASVNYGGVDYYAMHSATADMILASVIIP